MPHFCFFPRLDLKIKLNRNKPQLPYVKANRLIVSSAPRGANIQLNFTSLSDLALNMEHSVCKVSLAPHQRVIIGSLFEALDGLELGVNNYLFSLLWIACRNERLCRHLHRRPPPPPAAASQLLAEQPGGRTGTDAFPSPCLVEVLSQPLELQRAGPAARLSAESTSYNRCFTRSRRLRPDESSSPWSHRSVKTCVCVCVMFF